jgi:hypothetical protein
MKNVPSLFVIILLFFFSPSWPADSSVVKKDEGIGKNVESIAKQAQDAGITKEITQKLSAEQLVDIIKHNQVRPGERSRSVGELVPIVVPLGFFLALVMIILIPFIINLRKTSLIHSTLKVMIDKGIQIPPELLAPQATKKSDLRSGIILVCAGLAAGLALKLIVPGQVWAIGLIPFLIGIGYVVVWKLETYEKSKTAKSQENGGRLPG